MQNYKFMPLREIRKLEPEMKRRKVSIIARGRGGFLSSYKRADGKPENLSPYMKNKRENFIKRHNAQFQTKPTPRRQLALNAWAYKPRKSLRITPPRGRISR